MPTEAYTPILMNGMDIRLVARRQRWLLWLVLACLGSVVWPIVVRPIPFVSGESAVVVFAVLYVGVRVGVWLGTILMMRALRTHVVALILCALLMVVPLINLLILLMENRRATRVLRRAGLRVGFMGVKDEDVVIRLSPNLCHDCGYDLTGNVSGRCPECGTAIAVPVAPPAGGPHGVARQAVDIPAGMPGNS